jgi:hypothetical protein
MTSLSHALARATDPIAHPQRHGVVDAVTHAPIGPRTTDPPIDRRAPPDHNQALGRAAPRSNRSDQNGTAKERCESMLPRLEVTVGDGVTPDSMAELAELCLSTVEKNNETVALLQDIC